TKPCEAAMSDSAELSHCSNKDYDFFYGGLAGGKLLLQKCSACGTLRNPPGPMCPRCRSLAGTSIPAKGTGSVYSYIVHYHPPLPGFDTPHPVAVVDLDDGVRMIAAVQGVQLDKLRIGMRVQTAFGKRRGLDAFWF